MTYKWYIRILDFLIIIFITGCTFYPSIISPPTTTNTSQMFFTLTTTAEDYSTSTITTILPSTPTQLIITKTPIPTIVFTPLQATPILTHTASPTLNMNQQKIFFRDLLKDNAGCKLPCWWGITPGISTWKDLFSFLQFTSFGLSYSSISNDTVYHGTGYDWHEPLISNSIGFYDVKGNIEAIDVYAEGYNDKNTFRNLWNNYSPDQIIMTYSKPTEVYVNAGKRSGGAGAGIILKYNDEFMVMYSVKSLEVEVNGEAVFRICTSWQDITWYPEIYIFTKSTNLEMSLEEYVEFISSYQLDQFIPIEDAAKISIDEFYQRFLPGNGPACFDTPMGRWK